MANPLPKGSFARHPSFAFYEARTVFEGFLWGVNSFDQFGVELGKSVAEQLRRDMAANSQHPNHGFDTTDPLLRHYLEMLRLAII